MRRLGIGEWFRKSGVTVTRFTDSGGPIIQGWRVTRLDLEPGAELPARCIDGEAGTAVICVAGCVKVLQQTATEELGPGESVVLDSTRGWGIKYVRGEEASVMILQPFSSAPVG